MANLIPLQSDPVSPVLDGEILPPEPKCTTVTLQKHPFSQHHASFQVVEGATLYAIVIGMGLRPSILKYVRVWIGDEEIPFGVWHLVRPKAGTKIYVKLTPMGGGNMMRSLLMLVVVLAAAYLAPMIVGALGLTGLAAQIATPMISMGISMLGMWLVNMLIPPPKPPKLSERNFLDALRNRFNPFGPLPRVIGKKRVYPVIAAHPYTESSGGKRFLRAMLLLGYGPMRISDIRIGETPIGDYDNVQVEIREGWYDEAWGKFKLTAATRYDFNTTVQGFTGYNLTLSVVNGRLNLTPSATDPQLYRTGLSINGQRDYIVRAKIRRVFGTSWDGSLLYATANHSWSGSYYKSISNPFTRNGEWIICEWNMSSQTAGGSDYRNNTVTGIRLDLSADANTVYEIEWLEIGYPCGKDAERKLYTKSINQLDVSAKLQRSTAVIRTTEPESIGFGVDVQLPGGLGEQDKNDPGDIDLAHVTIGVSYRLLGTTAWRPAKWNSNIKVDGTKNDGQLFYEAKSRQEAMLGGWADFPVKGQYEVRLQRLTEDYTNSKNFGETYWQVLRSVKDTPSINDDLTGGLAIISIRAKATDQFQSFPDQVNCIAESYLPVPNSDGGWTYDITRNPAHSFVDILRHRGREALIDASRIDMNAMRDWAATCDATAPNSKKPYWQVDAQLEEGSLFENCREVAAHARASFIVNSGLYSVVRDIPQTVPVQLITPKNSWGYNGMKQFIDLPHALRINFTNADKFYRADERVVYDDGYSRANASRYETLDFHYCTDADQAYREARYHIAVGKLRPEVHRVTMDVENLRCTMGDYVMLAHDVISIGTGQGRVTALAGTSTSTSTITAFTLDEQMALASEKTYGARWRRGNTGAIYTAQIAAIPSTDMYDSFMLSAGVSSSTAPLMGDLVVIGEFGVESAPMLVKSVEPGPDMTATLTLVDAQPGVWTADTSVIPPFETYITDDVPIPQQKPATPTFRLVSDEQALVRQSDGSLPDQIMVIISQPTSSKLAVTGFQVQWRSSPGLGDGNWSASISTTGGTVYIPSVRAGYQYDVRVRSVSEYGLTSDWMESLNHTVIGKTTPPAQVKGLAGVAGLEGVQLSWTPNIDPDLKGYIIKHGTSWDAATLVSEVLSGTTVFIKCDTSQDQTFLVRSVDVVGNLSASDASVTTISVLPAGVTGLEGYLQNDVVFLKWLPVNMVGVRYEVRQGSDYKTARLIGSVTSLEIKTRVPVTASADKVFWVESVSPLGAYSGKPASVTITVLPLDMQNVIVTRDLTALSFPGQKQDVSLSGDSLILDADSSGIQQPLGHYYYPLDLGGIFTVRSWVETDTMSVAGAGVTWASANFTWASATDRTWLGSISSNRAGDIAPRLSIDSGFPASLIEGWRWNNTINGAKLGTTPTINLNTSYTNARFENGMQFARNTRLSYAVSMPSQFTLAIDVRILAGTNDGLLFKLSGVGFALYGVSNQSENVIVLFDSKGNILKVSFTIESTDVLTIVITQSTTQRAIYVSSRRHADVVSATDQFAALGLFTSIAFYE